MKDRPLRGGDVVDLVRDGRVRPAPMKGRPIKSDNIAQYFFGTILPEPR